MTDKVQRIREEVERLKEWNNNIRNSTRHMTLQEEDFNRGKHSSYLEILDFIDSLQEEQEHFLEDAPATDYEVPKIEAWLAREDETDTQLGYLYLYLHKPIRAEDVGQWVGHNGVIVWNEGKYKALKWEDEPLKVSLSILGDKPKKCMFTKEEFTEEDRKILCEDCEEECEYAKKEEPVSKDLGEYINKLSKQFPEVSFAKLSRIAVRVAKWQKARNQETIETAIHHSYHNGRLEMKEQMMAKAIDADCFGFQGAALFSFRLPADNYLVGSRVKVIVIK